MLPELQHKTVAILGYGVEGRAVRTYLERHGIKPVLFDVRELSQFPPEEQSELKNSGLNVIFGEGYLKELTGIDVAFRSPGLWRLNPDLLAAEKKGLVVTSQTKWFFDHAPTRIIGITGTKGKGTTASLIHEILLASGVPNFITGNIGGQQPLDILDTLSKTDWIVYELSSFQLQDLTKSPHIAVVLMTTSEHLDHHAGVTEYREAKANISKFQNSDDVIIINDDFPASKKIGEQSPARKFYFSRTHEVFAGSFAHGGWITARGLFSGTDAKLVATTELQLRGEHNLENACAATVAAALAGANTSAVINTLKHFRGLEHRLEFVAEREGISFYNDSVSTTPETAIAAVRSFTEPLILILGGASKKSDFSGLGKEIITARHIKGLILTGNEATRIKDAITQAGEFKGILKEGADTMPEIFSRIKEIAVSGDVVLLSPACTSFDHFADYQDRGNQFKLQVSKY